MTKAILVAALSGVLVTGAHTTGIYAAKGVGKLATLFHHHVAKPVAKASKAAVLHQIK